MNRQILAILIIVLALALSVRASQQPSDTNDLQVLSDYLHDLGVSSFLIPFYICTPNIPPGGMLCSKKNSLWRIYFWADIVPPATILSLLL